MQSASGAAPRWQRLSLLCDAVRFEVFGSDQAKSNQSQTKGESASRTSLARNGLAGSQSRHSKRAYLNSF